MIVRSIFFFGLSSLLALYVGTGLGGGRKLGEAALTTMLVAGAAGTVTGGRLADRFGRLPVIRASFAVTALGLAALALTGLLTPVLGALADATSLHLAVTVLAVFPMAGLALALRLRRPRSLAAAAAPPGTPPCNSASRL